MTWRIAFCAAAFCYLACELHIESAFAAERIAEKPSSSGATVPAIRADLLARTRKIADALKPSVRSWVENEARAERAKQNFDVEELKGSVRAQFDPARDGAAAMPGLSNDGAAEMAVIVILMMVQDGDQDLQQKTAEAQAQMQAKQTLRNLLNKLNSEQATLMNTAQGGCTSEAGLVSEVNAALAMSKGNSGQIACPVTTSQVAGAIQTLQNDLDSDNEVSEMTSMQLQMLMDTRSKLLQTASDMEKSMSDTDMAIVGNIKQ